MRKQVTRRSAFLARDDLVTVDRQQLVDVVDRLVVDSREWDDVPSCYPELVPYFERVAISDIVW